MDLGVLHSIATVSAFIAFIGIAWWAYSPKNKKRFEEDAQLALDDKDINSLSSQQRTKDTQ
ncbi:cbb3-type cytochrome c oxidase subunit 3 [Moraxella pluranimalium]|uniref:Cytochrome C n=1 Tax=Moraxella pluranimalium TaxID=470453 RepID=A0A1T0CTJ3_9GAMM|nr:cbb3-type cytochrome c oxidase subunit 3 [Moraxella pluranimalium]OOS25678.1 cytochrome C [Moraxella pluranimalium]